jgi:anthranilate phosphoribosyltransferase
VEKSIEKHGIGFMFAPNFHPAMKHAIGPRREIGIRTIFNVLGPLSNPANAKVQLVGVYDGKLTEKLAQVLSNLDVNKAMVVHGIDGLDEISTIGRTKISLLNNGKISTSYIAPKDIGVNMSSIEELAGSNPEESALTTFKILNDFENHKNKGNPKKDIVLVNAAATIFLGGKADSIKEGLEVARVSIQSGSAYEKLKSLIKFSDGEISKLEEMENA